MKTLLLIFGFFFLCIWATTHFTGKPIILIESDENKLDQNNDFFDWLDFNNFFQTKGVDQNE